MAKHTAKMILAAQSHMDPPEGLRKLAMMQGAPPPDRGMAHAAKSVEFYAEGDTLREAIEKVQVAMVEFIKGDSIDVEPRQEASIVELERKLRGMDTRNTSEQ